MWTWARPLHVGRLKLGSTWFYARGRLMNHMDQPAPTWRTEKVKGVLRCMALCMSSSKNWQSENSIRQEVPAEPTVCGAIAAEARVGILSTWDLYTQNVQSLPKHFLTHMCIWCMAKIVMCVYIFSISLYMHGFAGRWILLCPWIYNKCSEGGVHSQLPLHLAEPNLNIIPKNSWATGIGGWWRWPWPHSSWQGRKGTKL